MFRLESLTRFIHASERDWLLSPSLVRSCCASLLESSFELGTLARFLTGPAQNWSKLSAFVKFQFLRFKLASESILLRRNSLKKEGLEEKYGAIFLLTKVEKERFYKTFQKEWELVNAK